MIVLPVVAGTVVTATAVWFVWQARRVWLYGQRPVLRATATVTVVRPIQSHRPVAGRPTAAITAGRIIPGRVESEAIAAIAERQRTERRP